MGGEGLNCTSIQPAAVVSSPRAGGLRAADDIIAPVVFYRRYGLGNLPASAAFNSLLTAIG